MAGTIVTRRLREEETAQALELALRVFLRFEAPDYPPEGTETFAASLRDERYVSALRLYGAFCDGVLVGMLATRSEGTHIALFFVEERCQRQGVGRALFQAARSNCPGGRMTVHAAPCAVPFYRRLGFRDAAAERTEHGIRYVPMELPEGAACPAD